MIYILVIDSQNCMEFWVRDCAVIYQQILGGVIYSVQAEHFVIDN